VAARYADSFAQADHVLLAPVNNPEKVQDGNILDVPKIINELNKSGKSASSPGKTPEIISEILSLKEPPYAVLIMSNGGFDNIHQRLIDELQ